MIVVAGVMTSFVLFEAMALLRSGPWSKDVDGDAVHRHARHPQPGHEVEGEVLQVLRGAQTRLRRATQHECGRVVLEVEVVVQRVVAAVAVRGEQRVPQRACAGVDRGRVHDGRDREMAGLDVAGAVDGGVADALAVEEDGPVARIPDRARRRRGRGRARALRVADLVVPGPTEVGVGQGDRQRRRARRRRDVVGRDRRDEVDPRDARGPDRLEVAGGVDGAVLDDLVVEEHRLVGGS